MKKDLKSEHLHIRIDKGLKRNLYRMATVRHITVSFLVETLIRKEVLEAKKEEGKRMVTVYD